MTAAEEKANDLKISFKDLSGMREKLFIFDVL